MHRSHNIFFPHSNVSMKSATRSIKGNGYGTVLLDNGHGSQSSYNGIDDYIRTTKTQSAGRGLSDKINNKLSKLNISTKVRPKNITLSI